MHTLCPMGNLHLLIDGLPLADCSNYTSRVRIVNADTQMITGELPITNAADISFSPLGTFLSTWERPGAIFCRRMTLTLVPIVSFLLTILHQ